MQERQSRQQARSSFLSWCRCAGYKPAKHHLLLIAELQAVVDKLVSTLNNLTPEQREQEVDGLRLMVLMPPGSAKSTYISKLFPPWFLSQLFRIPIRELGILACSHEAGLATNFGRAARNLVDGNARWLGYTLKKDSRAADQWETTNGGYYQAAGVGAGIAGRRMHLGLIDDFCGSQEEAMSKLFNDKTWDWYQNDFVVRLQPFAARVIIANHRNEDDLVGRLLANEPAKWRVVRLRLLIETEEQAEQDPLGRVVGDYLWPEYFSRQQVVERMGNPYASGIEQQEPSPLKGAFFEKEHFQTYLPSELPPIEEGRIYVASDHAVSERETADNTAMVAAMFARGQLWILPDVVWKRLGSKACIEAMLDMAKRRKPLYWWAESGHITKSLLPLLEDRMKDDHCYINIVPVTPIKDKMARAQSIQGMMAMGMVRWPAKTEWFQRAQKEMLVFPNGKHDDFVDAVSWLGMGVSSMMGKAARQPAKEFQVNQGINITNGQLKSGEKAEQRLRMLALQDN